MLEFYPVKKVRKFVDERAEKQRIVKEADAKLKSLATTPKPTPASAAAPATSTEKSKHEPEPAGTLVLDREDEKFLERLTSPSTDAADDDEDGPPPALPPRVPTPVFHLDSDAESVTGGEQTKNKGKGKEVATKDDDKKAKRFSVFTNLGRNLSIRKNKDGLKPALLTVPKGEAHKEESELNRVLDDLNLSAQNNKAFSLSKESAEMVRKFTVVLKDLVNGVPTAYQDLVTLIEDRDGILAKNLEKLPSSLKKLVTQLPEKLTTTLAPELLAVAAEAQGLSAAEASSGGLKGAAKTFLTPKNLQDIVTKPGAVVGLLKGIVNALKLRWPAFIGTNVLWSVAVFLLLSLFWYCHKRGREERLLREAAEKEDPIDGKTRIEELPDDPLLPAPGPASGSAQATSSRTESEAAKLPPPPVGEHAKKGEPSTRKPESKK